MPTARSAGVVVYRISPRQTEPEFLLLDNGRFWDYPKGHVEAGEDDLTAALRELREEAGIADAELADGFRHEITYFFRDKRRRLIRKTVVFFLAQTDSSDVTLSNEHVGSAFLPFDEALARLSYPNAKGILQAAQDHLTRTPA